MSSKRKLTTQSVWDVPLVLAAFAEAGVKPMHAHRMWSHMIRRPGSTWADVVDMPKAALQLLDRHFVMSTSKVTQAQHSADGETSKLLVELQDGLQVESVIMYYDSANRYATPELDEPACSSSASTASEARGGHQRATLCVSSQVGCQMGCTFCATGTMGLKGNLTCGEILEQLVHARAHRPIRNIVFMGMGEPLNNYEPVRAAVAMMTDSAGFGLRRRHVTVSTVGIIPRIKQLADDLPGVSLALSLHAPTQELRSTIVPSARAYKLDKLMDAVKTYQANSGQKVFVEYVVLAGVNDGVQQAHELGALLQGSSMLLNLIPWNPVYSPTGPVFAAPSPATLAEFQSIIRGQYGVFTTVRQEKGQDISGACGQLVVEAQGAKSCSSEAKAVQDIEELLPALRLV